MIRTVALIHNVYHIQQRYVMFIFLNHLRGSFRSWLSTVICWLSTVWKTMTHCTRKDNKNVVFELADFYVCTVCTVHCSTHCTALYCAVQYCTTCTVQYCTGCIHLSYCQVWDWCIMLRWNSLKLKSVVGWRSRREAAPTIAKWSPWQKGMYCICRW